MSNHDLPYTLLMLRKIHRKNSTKNDEAVTKLTILEKTLVEREKCCNKLISSQKLEQKSIIEWT